MFVELLELGESKFIKSLSESTSGLIKSAETLRIVGLPALFSVLLSFSASTILTNSAMLRFISELLILSARDSKYFSPICIRRVPESVGKYVLIGFSVSI